MPEKTLKDFLMETFGVSWGSLQGQSVRNANGDVDQSSLGYKIAITTLTYLRKKVVEQVFYKVPFAEYVPVVVGEGAFSSSILTHLSFDLAGPFEAGNINQASHNARLTTADAGVSSKSVAVVNWAKEVGYTIFELEQALRAVNWDMITAKHKALKRNYDLGLQEICFLGSLNNSDVPGLLTQSGVNSDTTTITEKISSMSAAEFNTFVAAVVQAFRANCNYTAYPTDFVIPEDDWNGLCAPVSADFPVNSKLEYLKRAFAEAVPGGVNLRPLVYSQPTFNTDFGVNLHRYVMYNKDEDTLRMEIPVSFTQTQPATHNNFNFQDVGYCQYSGLNVFRPLEVLYFDF